jgi:soluble lytic murein transglycosylase-like protein
MRKRILITAGAVGALASFATVARAGESVTLRNGFAMQCNRHAQVEGRTRLYLTAGDDNYIEFAPEEIVAVAAVPDPPAQVQHGQAPDGMGLVQETGGAKAGEEARLNAADLLEMLVKAGSEHNLDADLLASLVKAESDGNARAVSRAGARGLMQLMPGTATELGVEDSFEPGENVRGGSAYLDALLTRYHGQLALALAAYNAGPQAVDRYHGIPPYHETRAYVARVIHEFNRRVLAREALARQELASASARLDKLDKDTR